MSDNDTTIIDTNKKDNTNTTVSDEVLDDNDKKRSLSFKVLLFIVVVLAITTAYYYSVLWLIIKLHLIDTMSNDIKVLTLVSGVGCSFYIGLLLLKKFDNKGEY